MATEGFSAIRQLLAKPPNSSSPILAASLAAPPKDKSKRLDDLVLNLRASQSSEESPTPPPAKAPRLSLLSPFLAPSPQQHQSPLLSHLNQLSHFLLAQQSGRTEDPESPEPQKQASTRKPDGCSLTRPKLSRHNDAAYYPNIQCILCSEWVCSRNRYMHIESHLQYRPYKCSLCGYDNRKEIFINLHLKRTHGGRGSVLYQPDPDLEHRAWQLAEKCLQHTRQVLTKVESKDSQSSEKVLEPYRDVYRPKIYNSQRAEKSQLIEESRQLGLVPDFSEVAAKEELCSKCGAHILRHHAVLEEHVRTHLPGPSYRCNISGCSVSHESKNFIARHMKEVHKYRRQPLDLLEDSTALVESFMNLCQESFPLFFHPDALRRIKYRYSTSSKKRSFQEAGPSLLLPPSPSSPSLPASTSKTSCGLCKAEVSQDLASLLEHILSHVSGAQFLCLRCGHSEASQTELIRHASSEHPGSHNPADIVQKILTPESKAEVEALFKACFPSAQSAFPSPSPHSISPPQSAFHSSFH